MSEANKVKAPKKVKEFRSPLLAFFTFGMAAGLLYGLVTGLINLFGSAALPLGLGRLGLETISRDLGDGLRWGFILGFLLFCYGWVLTKVTGSTRKAIVAQIIGMFFWLLGLVGVILILLKMLGQKLPLPYQEDITPSVFLSRFVMPGVGYAVTTKPLMVWLIAMVSFLIPFSLGAIFERIFRARIEKLPINKIPSLAMSKKGMTIAGLILGVFIVAIVSPAAMGRPTDVPNVLMISIDTLRADGLSSYGNPVPTSPVMDKLAAEGMRFENFFSTAPWTLPGHVTMMTGLEPPVHGTYELYRTIPREAPLLSELFKNKGYNTLAVTSNFLVGPPYGFGRGFDNYILRPEEKSSVITGIALRMMRRVRDPWFVFVHYFDPHLPYKPTEQSKEELGIKGPEVDKVLSSMTHLLYRFIDLYLPYNEKEKEAVWQLYTGCVRDVDRQIGILLDNIDLKNTIVIITSDHGEEFNEHGWSGHTVALYDESLRIPLIVHGPGVEQGVVISDTTDLTQLAPLVIKLAKLDDPLKRGEPQWGRGAFGHTDAFGNNRYSWRQNGWSFLTRNQYHYGTRDIEHAPGLFNDRKEQENLLSVDPQRAAEMQDEMDHFIGREIQRYGNMETGSQDIDEEQLQRLRELGYVQ